MSEHVIKYLIEYIEKAKKSAELDKINSQIELVRKYKNDIDELINEKFNVQLENDDNDYFADYYIERFTLFKEYTKDEIKFLKRDIFMLHTNFDSELIEFKKAREEILSIQRDFSEKLSELHKYAKTISNVADTDLVALLGRIIKKIDDTEYKISGNVNSEEYEMITSLLNKSGDLLIEDKIAFIRELNDAIVDFKYRKEKIDKEMPKLEEDEETEIVKASENRTESFGKKMGTYDYSRIKRSKAKLMQSFTGNPSEIRIFADTPYDWRTRSRIYKPIDAKDYDYETILYDLNNFIDPDKLDEMYDSQKISRDVLDTIRNRIYREIIQIVDRTYLQNRTLSEKNIEKDSVEEKEEKPIVIPETSNVEEIVSTPTDYVVNGEMTHEEAKRVLEAITMADEYSKEFYQIYKYDKVLFESCLAYKTTEGYDFSLEMVELVIKTIPDMKKKFNDYKTYYDYVKKTNEEEAKELFLDTKESLLASVSKVLNAIETMTLIEEEKVEPATLNNSKNFVLIYQDPLVGSKLLQQDIEEITKGGGVTRKQIYDGFEALKFLDTISPTEDSCNKIKPTTTAHAKLTKKYNPRRHRHSDIRYSFINIYLCDENKEFLMKYYGETDSQIRLLFVPTIFYKRGEVEGYVEALKRIDDISGDENKLGSIEWIKGIFGNPFTKETREMAIKLLDSSTGFINSIKELSEVKDVQEFNSIMEGEIEDASKQY